VSIWNHQADGFVCAGSLDDMEESGICESGLSTIPYDAEWCELPEVTA
jgi:hypothetical protein